jgi:hypothetical protein
VPVLWSCLGDEIARWRSQLGEAVNHLALVRAGTPEINRWVNSAPNRFIKLEREDLSNADLSGALFRGAHLSNTSFCDCKLQNTIFDNATLTGTRFLRCDLRNASFRSTTVSSLTMTDCILDNASFRESKGFSQIIDLRTARIVDSSLDVDFDLHLCPFLDRALAWNNIRTIGNLRLFTPAYGALTCALFALITIALLNQYLSWLSELVYDLTNRGILSKTLGERLTALARPWQPSWRPLAVLLSTASVAIGATLYLLCPSRVREFTMDQWRFISERPAFEYHSWCWSRPLARSACAFFYSVGAAVAAVLLIETFYRVIVLLLST